MPMAVREAILECRILRCSLRSGSSLQCMFLLTALLPVNVVATCRFAAFAMKPSAVGSSDADRVDALFAGSSNALSKKLRSDAPFSPYSALSPLYNYDEERRLSRDGHCKHDGWAFAWQNSNDGTLRVRRGSSTASHRGSRPSEEVAEATKSLRSLVTVAHVGATASGADFFNNSQPFVLSELIWLHHGRLSKESLLREALVPLIHPLTAKIVRGSTSSELLGAYFVSRLNDIGDERTVEQLEQALKATIDDLVTMTSESTRPRGREACSWASSFNFVLSNGKDMLVSRVRSCPTEDPPALYISWRGEGVVEVTQEGACDFKVSRAACRLAPIKVGKRAADMVWFSNEPLDNENGAKSGEVLGRVWAMLPKDSIAVFDSEAGTLRISCVTEACEDLSKRVASGKRVGHSNDWLQEMDFMVLVAIGSGVGAIMIALLIWTVFFHPDTPVKKMKEDVKATMRQRRDAREAKRSARKEAEEGKDD
eukprot:TRINITY_DN56109_c0_g1_i1.p1 TRINITY_DN56109_c0_g1~~TRINITY_DN56109_c0_g1_i1.p1  ORF type:complete len:482 (-),score=86.57 TRINITY_DN56109_c0_g1_i1:953-2398(-)